MASPILRETIKKLKARRALLQRQVKGPLEELRQIEEDLRALAAAPSTKPARAKAPATSRAAPGANQAAILRAIRNGATTPEEIAEKTGIATATVTRAVTISVNRHKLLTRGATGLTLTRRGRERLAELEGRTV